MRRRLTRLAQEDAPFQIQGRLAANQHAVALQLAAQVPATVRYLAGVQ